MTTAQEGSATRHEGVPARRPARVVGAGRAGGRRRRRAGPLVGGDLALGLTTVLAIVG
ncbi:hypothetical protein [Micromonospora sp. KC606]|uniref:hypothetical protein n=1 Tax=Micromonospora sp. KC606 TaxID=2530379 RepID=UPI00140520EF|nr:hypothetical protein [Micromonospora sp. KC606]